MNAVSREALDALKTKQIAFFAERLVSNAAEAEWRANLEPAYRALLSLPLDAVATPDATLRVVEAAITAASYEGLIAPISKAIHDAIAAELRADATPLGDYVPESARAKIGTLLERPGLVPEKVVRQVFEQEAMEGVMRDVLFDALKTFNENVNPFFADWGLPFLIKKFLPIGSGAVLKSMEAVRGEFDKRLDPEIRKFLQTFARKSLSKMADFALASSGDPKSFEIRKAIVGWFYEQETKSLVTLDADGVALVHGIGNDIGAHVAALPASKAKRSKAIADFFAANGKNPLAEVLVTYGITSTPDFDALAAASWPLVKAVIQSEPVRRWFEGIVAEFFDGVEAS